MVDGLGNLFLTIAALMCQVSLVRLVDQRIFMDSQQLLAFCVHQTLRHDQSAIIERSQQSKLTKQGRGGNFVSVCSVVEKWHTTCNLPMIASATRLTSLHAAEHAALVIRFG